MTGESQGGQQGPRGVFRAWERLRLWYNLILVVTTVLIGLRIGRVPVSLADVPHFVVGLLPLAVAANVCFFTGPAIEAYVNWLGAGSPWIRPVIFTAGVVISLLLCWVILTTPRF